VVVYVETFNDLTGATQASDYITYGLVDTVAGRSPIRTYLFADNWMSFDRLSGYVQLRHGMCLC